MKTLLCALLTSLLMGCGPQDDTAPNCNVNTDYTSDLTSAKRWIIGEWRLTGVTAMSLNPTVGNVRLSFSQKGEVRTIKDDKLTETNRYEIVQTQYALLLKTDAEPRSDNWYVRDPVVRICTGQMFLDGGIANDGPGFTFQRIR